jgi:hypothetical protein
MLREDINSLDTSIEKSGEKLWLNTSFPTVFVVDFLALFGIKKRGGKPSLELVSLVSTETTTRAGTFGQHGNHNQSWYLQSARKPPPELASLVSTETTARAGIFSQHRNHRQSRGIFSQHGNHHQSWYLYSARKPPPELVSLVSTETTTRAGICIQHGNHHQSWYL